MDEEEEIARYANRSLGRSLTDQLILEEDLEEEHDEKEGFGDFVDNELEMSKFKDYVEESSLLGEFFTYLTQKLPSFVYECESERGNY